MLLQLIDIEKQEVAFDGGLTKECEVFVFKHLDINKIIKVPTWTEDGETVSVENPLWFAAWLNNFALPNADIRDMGFLWLEGIVQYYSYCQSSTPAIAEWFLIDIQDNTKQFVPFPTIVELAMVGFYYQDI